MFLEEYAAKIFPSPRRVLGIPLVPLTIGHALLLYRIQSPFFLGGDVLPGQLVRAIYCLSRPCAAAADGLQSRRVAWLLRLWGRQVKWLTRQPDRDLAVTEIDKHIEEAFRPAPLWEEDTPGSACSAPYLAVLKVSLMTTFNLDPERALNYPINQAIWDLACDAERKGRTTWVSEAQAKAIRAME